MIRSGLFLWAVVLLMVPVATWAQVRQEKPKQQQMPVLLELFTSQSCSSCPPADKVLRDMSDRRGVIALSCHVTYWNHLHWRDTLSLDACTKRQRDYVRALKSRGPYTPQLVVQGRDEMVGSRRNAVVQAIHSQQARQAPFPLVKLNIVHDTSRVLNIALPALPVADGRYHVMLFAYQDNHHQQIASGENRGLALTYHHPVRDIVDLGQWRGDEKQLQYNLADLSARDDVDGLVVSIHEGTTTGAVLWSGFLKL